MAHPDEERRAYETEANRQNEGVVVNFLQEMMGWKDVRRTPRYYPCDWVVEQRPGLWGLLEVKVRERHYLNYMVSLHKATNLLTMAKIGGFVPMLAVAWKDKREVGLWNPLREEYFMPGVGGRTDRQDAQDTEPVVLVGTKYCQPYAWL